MSGVESSTDLNKKPTKKWKEIFVGTHNPQDDIQRKMYTD